MILGDLLYYLGVIVSDLLVIVPFFRKERRKNRARFSTAKVETTDG